MLLVRAIVASSQVIPIHQVQGNGPRSPYEGQVVRVRGVVTGVAPRGFFVQEVEPDGESQTSEGLFVFTNSPPEEVTAGKFLEIQGKVNEYVPSSTPFLPPLTELVNPSWSILEQGYELPLAVLLDANLPNSDPSGWDQLEALEGMRVEVEELVVSAPTQGTVDETTASSQSTGVFFGVVRGQPRPFREPGFPQFGLFPRGQVPRFDGNPEVLRVDSRCLVGKAPLDVAVGTVIRGLRGPMTFASGRFTLCPEPETELTVVPSVQPSAPPDKVSSATVVIASWNVQRFYDDENDGGEGPVLTSQAWALRKTKFVTAVLEHLQLPHVLVVQEIESELVLRKLAGALNEEVRSRFGFDPGYVPYLLSEGGFGPQIGMLVASTPLRGVTAEATDVQEILSEANLANPDGSTSPLFDRPPLTCRLVLRALRRAPLVLELVGIHLRSINGLLSQEAGAHGWPSEGERVREKRKQQAEQLARWIEAWQQEHPERPLVVLGDFNAFEFADGVVDVVGTVAGIPAPAATVSLPTEDLVSRDLKILTKDEHPSERYSYIHDGSAQALDHILVSSALLDRGVEWRVHRPRLAADWPEGMRALPEPWRLSDHDPLVLYLDLPRLPVPVLKPKAQP